MCKYICAIHYLFVRGFSIFPPDERCSQNEKLPIPPVESILKWFFDLACIRANLVIILHLFDIYFKQWDELNLFPER